MIWQELIKTALIGTDRNSLSEETKQDIAKMGIDINQSESQIVLEASAYFHMLHKAGHQLDDWEGAIITPCPSSEDVFCSANTSDHLSLILSSYIQALPELLFYLAHAKKTLPPEHLPSLIKKAVVDQKIWNLLQGCMGSRGHWLISQNPAWKHLLQELEVSLFTTGNRIERTQIIANLRKTNPAQALELIQSTWEEDDLATRTQFIKSLEINLSIEDEPWLEEQLDNSRKEIRSLATHLLHRLEDSRLIERTFERLQKLMVFEKKKLTINLPSKCSAEMVRDGIQDKKKWKNKGFKAGYLGQMMTLIPMEKWNQFLATGSLEAINIFLDTEYADIVFIAWINSNHLLKNKEWLETLLDYIIENLHTPFVEDIIPALNLPNLLAKIPSKLYNQLILTCFEQEHNLANESNLVFYLVRHAPTQIPKEIAQKIIVELCNVIKGSDYFYENTQLKLLIKNLGYKLQPAIYPWVEKTLEAIRPEWGSLDNSISLMLNAMRFRVKMGTEILKKQD